MITDVDVTKLKGIFATKEELAEFRADVKVEFEGVNRKFEDADGKIDTMAAAIGRIENTLDGIAGAIKDQQIENGAGAAHLVRHDRQIGALAFATGVALPD